MKNISIKYSESGLNSPRLILNAIVAIMESNEPGGIVEVSPENDMEAIQALMENSLTYKVNAGIMTSRNLRTKTETTYLQAFVS